MYLEFLLALLISLVVTLLVELLVAHFFSFRTKNERKTIILATFITFFALNALIQILGRLSYGMQDYQIEYYIIVTLLEVLVVIVEYKVISFVYESKYGKKKILWLAISMNAASYIIGLVAVKPLLELIFGYVFI